MKNLKIIDKLITEFAERVLVDMARLSDQLQQEVDLTPVEKARQDLNNKDILKKLYARQLLLSILRFF